MSDEAKKQPEEVNAAASPEIGQPAAPTVNWDDSEMQTSHVNVVNASSTREEVSLFFGTNETWNPGASKEFRVKLKDRIVMNPHAAKRLFVLLGTVLARYEKQHGEIKLQGLEAAAEMIKKQQAQAGSK